MKLGVMSDSHDNIPNVKRAVAAFQRNRGAISSCMQAILLLRLPLTR